MAIAENKKSIKLTINGKIDFSDFQANKESGAFKKNVREIAKVIAIKRWLESKGKALFCVNCEKEFSNERPFQMAHIHASNCDASCGDANCKPAERKNVENLALLCSVCNKLMYNSHARFFFNQTPNKLANFLKMASLEASEADRKEAIEIASKRQYDYQIELLDAVIGNSKDMELL